MKKTAVAPPDFIHPLQYYDIHDINTIALSRAYEELTPVAFRVIHRIPGPIAMICGPISTGGLGSITKNLAAFKEAIERVAKTGEAVFTQMPFESAMQDIKGRLSPGCDATSLMDTFYRPLFESGLIKRLYFLPGWQGSWGARWEHQLATKLRIEIRYL